MQYPLEVQWHGEGAHRFRLYVPVAADVQRMYQQAISSGKPVAFPYWAKIWPAAIALSRFIVEHTAHIQNKRVLELAAGVGLPSMQAAFFASHVICSDSDSNAVATMQRSINANAFKHVEACVIDWNNIPPAIQPEVILLSDINYEPAVFGELFKLLMDYKEQKITILLATPQRLMARTFIERLLPHCADHLVMQAVGEDVSIVVM